MTETRRTSFEPALCGILLFGNACFADPPTPLNLLGDGSMILVPGGSFEMGTFDAEPDEAPARIVQVDEFYMDEEEVTVAEYALCVDAGECEEPKTGESYNFRAAGRDAHPINGVTWTSAQDYCAWVDGGIKRLPTEAEWEFAARGTDARVYPWGDEPAPSCEYAVMDEEGLGRGCGEESTLQVGSRLQDESPFGLKGMGGNVSEWVSDWYGEYDEVEVIDPVGPVAGELRVTRGGSWIASLPRDFRTTTRSAFVPDATVVSVGFRCVSKVLP